jgi:hypothetical protein
MDPAWAAVFSRRTGRVNPITLIITRTGNG